MQVDHFGLAANQQLLLYVAGCIKNVSNDAANQKALARLGGVLAMSLLLQAVHCLVSAGWLA